MCAPWEKRPCNDIIEIETDNNVDEEDKAYEENRNYEKANINDLKRFCEEMDWGKLKRANDVQDKYDIFMELYETGVKKYVPLYKLIEKGKQVSFNA